MTDMLDYAGFYAYETGGKFDNHHRIRNVDETLVLYQVKFIIKIQNLRIVIICPVQQFKMKE